ncbi:hypothetical protein [Tengunoibacter tsumagoiensis]|uniref:Ferric oxidoreductase domain-containing protein n=1 Tax=Tengunoibacter tsumagoiensis TaxID=2014871 RepID=A0A402A800_9CHLR|nr:hypothetical protein [Tengunoibacter tsumagoiensis]GCE15284.1 hypothetical protein KTT_51430 [Tengunoibacter tsumagoiensis]
MDVLFTQLVEGLIGILLVAVLAVLAFLLIYGTLRLLRLPVSWGVWTISIFSLLLSVTYSVFLVLQGHSLAQLRPLQEPGSNLGFLSFLIMVYSLGQWLTRRLYLLMKKTGQTVLTTFSRNILLVLRKYHPLFGWVVGITATAHMFYYIFLLVLHPTVDQRLQRDLLLGTVAWLVLGVLLSLGFFVEKAVERKKLPKGLRTLHFVTALAFLGIIIVHVSLK